MVRIKIHFLAKGTEWGPLGNIKYDEDCQEKEMCERDTINLCVKCWAYFEMLMQEYYKKQDTKTWRTAIMVDHYTGLSHGCGWSQKL